MISVKLIVMSEIVRLIGMSDIVRLIGMSDSEDDDTALNQFCMMASIILNMLSTLCFIS